MLLKIDFSSLHGNGHQGQKAAVVIAMADDEELMEDVADLAAVADRWDEDRISLDDLKQQLMADGLLPR